MDAGLSSRFNAAVDVIKGLPKDGPFKPSHEMQLNLYGYYKQATNGPCKESKPSFWDVVKKAKWDAWAKLGDMSRGEAMSSYVSELVKIIGMMPPSKGVSDILSRLNPQIEQQQEKESEDDLHSSCSVQPLINTVSTGADQQELMPHITVTEVSQTDSSTLGMSLDETILVGEKLLNAPTEVGLEDTVEKMESDSENEAFCDSSEILDLQPVDHYVRELNFADNKQVIDYTQGIVYCPVPRAGEEAKGPLDDIARVQVSETVLRLHEDMQDVLSRLKAVEARLAAMQRDAERSLGTSSPKFQFKLWWSEHILSFPTAAIAGLMAWPFFVFWLLSYFSKRQRR